MVPRAPSPRFVCALLALVSATACSGDGGGGTEPDPTDAIASVVVVPASIVLNVGETRQLSATVRNGRGEIVVASVAWSSSAPSVATVSPTGLLTGVGAGSGTVRASAGGRSATVAITGIDPAPPEAPSGLLASALSHTEVLVSWVDMSDNEDEFVVERQVGAGGVAATGDSEKASAPTFVEAGRVAPNETSFRDVGLNPATSYVYRVKACNANGCSEPAGGSGDAAATTTYEALILETDALPDGFVGTAYSTTMETSGGNGPASWRLVAGALPPGLGLAAQGTISGTPTVEGRYDFTVEAAGAGQTAQRDVAITILPPPGVTTVTLPSGVRGAAYAATLTASGGDGSFAWQLTAGALPPGVTLDGDGSLSGIPTGVGEFTFTALVTSGGLVATADLSISVFEPLAVTSGAVPTGVLGLGYGQALGAAGGDGTFSWRLAAGALPEGLGLAEDGTLSGIPTSAGTSSFTVEVRSGDGQTATAILSLTVYAPLEVTTAGLATGLVGTPYGQTLAATGGDGVVTWSLASGALPAGLVLDPSTGAITGIPTAAGTFAITVRAASGDGQTATAELSLTVDAAPAPVTLTTGSLPDGSLGSAYLQVLSATGGDGTYAWAITAGSLPVGLVLSPSTGTISGSPVSTGTFAFTVQVASAGLSDSRALTITVGGSAVVFDRSYLVGGYLGVPYGDQVAPATGGDGTVTYAVTQGALPAGLSLDGATGAIAGTPAGAGMAFFEITASSGGSAASVVFAITISTAPPGAFNLWGVNVAATVPTAAVQAAINAVFARWEAIVTGDALAFLLPDSGLDGQCGGNGPLLHGAFIDDVVVLLDIDVIDGPGSGGLNTLGFGGICGFIRSLAPNTMSGQLTLDSFDLATMGATRLFDLIWHEVGHVMGIGSLWDFSGFLTGKGTTDPRFTGPAAVAEFTLLGGGAPDIPVEGDFGPGTRDSHWDEGFFDTEIMTGFLDGGAGAEPISRMTVASLADLGWTVSLAAADAYSIPGCSPACAPPLPAPGGALVRATDIVLHEPLILLWPDGSTVVIPIGR